MPPKKKAAATTAAPEEDVSMADASPAPADVPEPEYDIEIDEQRIRILPGASDTAASFEFKKEDHTLGNALRYIIMKNPDVEFCGYSIPHPSEELMNIRIQTYEGTTAVEALEKGFNDLMDLCDVVSEKFQEERLNFIDQMKA
ncbi:RBP11-like subunits of RNA polymerase [Hyaloscypha bicolor E]|uniref:DNA-directed RNA polymerases I and III subunit RPAC2 n=1 Tax=Hyaloscypha bicolor E TaxID=1095630 RepID=A0A2J6TPV9_9HELO|nr:RBP11-like subunits of RNA polymerase [Hyaloscypha bicolor E]PMD65061.1 RBP11-like subunits of RNA polymerase [Hyaloscypha bicolor E]